MNTGKSLRLRRIMDAETGTTVMFAFSHGTRAPEVLPGLEQPTRVIEAAASGGADCVFLAPGLIEAMGDLTATTSLGVAVKVSATASRGGTPYQEVLTTSVERSLELGADAVVALIPFAPENEPAVIALTAQRARLCSELGADIIKSNWTGSIDSFAEIVESVPVPVVVAGGSRESDLDLLLKLQAAREAGAVGRSVGRNIFQHEAPERMVRAICAIFKNAAAAREAYDAELGEVTAQVS